MNIAIVSEFSIASYPGGGEKRYFELAKQLVALGHSVTWLCMSRPGGKREENTEGIRVVYLGAPVKAPPFRSVFNFLSFNMGLIRHLRAHAYDVVDAQAFSPLLGAYLGTLFKDAILVATIHDAMSRGAQDFFQYPFFARVLEPILYRLPFKQVVTVSHASADMLVERFGVSRDKVFVIHNGVSLADVDQVPQQFKRYDYIFVGRLVPSKHVADFVELCVRTQRTGAIVGDGPQRSEIQNMCLAHKNITFLGRKTSSAEVIEAMKQAKVLVLPSTREGFGLVLVEAGAAGLPVIAYEIGGVVEVIDHGENGFLVPPRDIDSLCRVAEEAVSDALVGEMGRAGRRKVEQYYTWENAAKKLEQVYAVNCPKAVVPGGDVD